MNKLVLTLLALVSLNAVFASDVVKDEFVEEWFKDKGFTIIEPYKDYDYTNLRRTKIILSPVEKFSTPNNIEDGQKVNMRVKRNARIGRDLLKSGTPAEATVEQYITNGMTGIQAVIVLGKIKIEGLESDNLRYYCLDEGQNRTLWIMPLKWALTWLPFVGSLTNLIKGGQAVLCPADDFVVYYYY